MQQTCVDDVLMRNYTELNNTESLNKAAGVAVGGVISYKCEPFDCNDHGRCSNGTCVCYRGRVTMETYWCYYYWSAS